MTKLDNNPLSGNILPSLRTTRIAEQREKLSGMSDRELCEAVRAHFNSHPMQTEQKDLELQAAEALKKEGEIVLPVCQRGTMINRFSAVQIQEAPIEAGSLECDPHTLGLYRVARTLGLDRAAARHNTAVYRMDVQLQKEEDGSVSVIGNTDAGRAKLCSLPDNFLRSNPMNMDRCDAEVELMDFFNGKTKNPKVCVVVNSDEMSGDVVKMNNDMLAGLGQDTGLGK